MTHEDDIRLVVVTGKGGTGRTTVATALALDAAARGRRAVVCEVGGQAQVPRLLARSPAAAARGGEQDLGGGLWSLTIDAEGALEEWMARQVPRRLVAPVLRSGAFAGFVRAAPGARELLTVTKAWELGQERRWRRDERPFDTVILDAPASGHGLGMLRTPRTFAEIARVGPIAVQARTVAEALGDPARSRIVAVALATELAVSETLELETAVQRALGRGLDGIVANGLWPRRLSSRDAEAVASRDGALSPRVHRATTASATRVRTQQAHLARLRREASAPVQTLPFVFTEQLGPDDLRAFGRRLSDAD